MPETWFDITEQADRNRFVLSITGELDLATMAAFEDALREVCANGAAEVVVDLSRVTFIGSAGLRALLSGYELCVGEDRSYTVVRGESKAVARVFEIAGIDDDVLPSASLDDADRSRANS